MQYHFDKRFDFYSDSERISTKVNRRFFYRHSDLMKSALDDLLDDNFTYSKCNENNSSDLIIKLEPNFFYNPLMETMYADLTYKVYVESNQLIRTSTVSSKKQMYLQALPQEQLKNIYVEFIKTINKELDGIHPTGKIQGLICRAN